jgi:hypothetical protein
LTHLWTKTLFSLTLRLHHSFFYHFHSFYYQLICRITLHR